MSKKQILKEFEMFRVGNNGIGAWLTDKTRQTVFDRLDTLNKEPLSMVQFNQLLALGHEAPVSQGCFEYYWLEIADSHPYLVNKSIEFDSSWLESEKIQSLSHLKWGLYRLYCDGLLYFGNVRTAYKKLRVLTKEELVNFFSSKKINTQEIKARGAALALKNIARDSRYLISEMACKSFGSESGGIKQILDESYEQHLANGGGQIKVKDLLSGNLPDKYQSRQMEIEYSTVEIDEVTINSQADYENKIDGIANKFEQARTSALSNTEYYLSMVHDLDVYVATSMRTREDFRDMAKFCDNIFAHDKVEDLQLRYFDPTLSAASGHEDKGLIECLMVKCARALIYCAGKKESYGKDVEAGMALSQGKPVIFYCSEARRGNFYRDVHPLSRLIEFDSGVAVGVMVATTEEQVVELLHRLFENKMEYELDKTDGGGLRLKEKLTDSIVRLQTGDPLLSETFWNHYHNKKSA